MNIANSRKQMFWSSGGDSWKWRIFSLYTKKWLSTPICLSYKIILLNVENWIFHENLHSIPYHWWKNRDPEASAKGEITPPIKKENEK